MTSISDPEEALDGLANWLWYAILYDNEQMIYDARNFHPNLERTTDWLIYWKDFIAAENPQNRDRFALRMEWRSEPKHVDDLSGYLLHDYEFEDTYIGYIRLSAEYDYWRYNMDIYAMIAVDRYKKPGEHAVQIIWTNTDRTKTSKEPRDKYSFPGN